MTKKDYADILKFAINGQIEYAKEELEGILLIEESRYLEGIIRGLKIALEKIDASAFLWEKE
jgi:hypothetical protein